MNSPDDSNDNDTSRMNRREFLQTAGLATLAMGSGATLLASGTAQATSSPKDKPNPGGAPNAKRYNVLFIMTDQERYLPGLLGKGHWLGRDRLAKMGTSFENHQVNSMVCTPSRSVIFTGQHIQHTRMFDNTDFPWIENLSYDMPTIGHMMREAGYYTTYQGKWHLNSALHEHFEPGDPLQLVGQEVMDKYGFSDFIGVGDIVGETLHGYYTDQFVTATAQAWLRKTGKRLNNEGQPWFMSLSLVNPHDVMFYDTDKPGQPVQGKPKPMMPIAREPDDTIYKQHWDAPLPASRTQSWDAAGRPQAHYDYQQAMGMLTGVIPNEDARWQRMQDYYFNCISDNDRSVENVLAELDNLGMTDNTIIVFTADHGELGGAHGMSGKGSTAYHEQNNVPFILYHPDIAGGKTCKAVTAHNDIVPTILAMTGADKQQAKSVTDNLHGHDVSQVLNDPQAASTDAIRKDGALYCFSMWAFMDANWLKSIAAAAKSGQKMTLDTLPRPEQRKRSNIRTVYDGRYKYSRYFNSRQHHQPATVEQIFELNDVELYDLENDPHEIRNLALDTKHHDVLLAMNSKLNRLIASEVGKDDGSHLPDINGVNWAVSMRSLRTMM